MQPFIGPPIPIHLLATTSGWMHVIAVALVVLSLAVHIFFYVWIFRFLKQWGRDNDERRAYNDKQEQQLVEQERQWEAVKRQWNDETERLRETLERVRGTSAAH